MTYCSRNYVVSKQDPTLIHYFIRVKLINRNEWAQIYTEDKGFIWIIPLFIKAEEGTQLRDFSKQVGIPNELHLDRDTETMLQKSDFQCTLQYLFPYSGGPSETCSPCHECSKNIIGIIKAKRNRRIVRRKVPKIWWIFGLVWEAKIYYRASYKCGHIGM